MRTFHFGVGDKKKGGTAFRVETNKDNPSEVFLRCNNREQLEALCNRLNLNPDDIVTGRANSCLAMSPAAALTIMCRVWEDNFQEPPAWHAPYTQSDRLGMGLALPKDHP